MCTRAAHFCHLNSNLQLLVVIACSRVPDSQLAMQERTTLYLYEVKNMLVASQVLKGAADGGSTLNALQAIRSYII